MHAAVTRPPLAAWHESLSTVQAPRSLRLPASHPDGSHGCTLLALLGDSLLRTAVLSRLMASEAGEGWSCPESQAKLASAGRLATHRVARRAEAAFGASSSKGVVLA